ncbi:MAG: c-type cytochrome [Gemmatimonadaceae bacterium]
MKRTAIVALALSVICGCTKEQPNVANPPHSTSSEVNAAPAVTSTDTTVFPGGPEGTDARRGFAILAATRDSMPGYVGNQLSCFSCHINNGHRQNGILLTGVYARYPNYSARDSRMITIQDRINNCFRRSLAGRNVPLESKEMHDIVTYLALVSRGVAVGTHVAGEGLPKLPRMSGDPSRGETMFVGRCARCHGANGQGIPPATPLWGPGSFSIGASLSRVERAASFIRHNMPLDSAGVLTDQQAYDVASYIVSQPRRESHDTRHDWANGGAPWDVPYNTKGHAAFNPPKHLLPSAFQ